VAKRPLTRQEKNAVGALIALSLLNIMFWAIYEQQGNTLQLWADQKTDWVFLGFEVPSSWFQAFNPFMIFIIAPILDIFWGRQARKGKEPSSVTKMGIGCILCGGAYILMFLAAQAVPGSEKASVLWLVATVLVFTLGELYLSPIGLSLVTKVAPKPIMSMMMGLWFLSSFFGNYMTGYLGMFYETMTKGSFFLMLTAMGISTGLIFFAIRKPMQKIIGKSV
jgi:POT family proton-dependent oligopeptide transporter